MTERKERTWGSKAIRAAVLFAFVFVMMMTVNAISVKAATYTVSVQSGYLALRTAPAYDDSNIIGKLYSGDQVETTGTASGKYYWVYSSKLGMSGYVNSEYLIGSTPSGPSYTVSVKSGYLALRTAAAYDDSNIIGKLYSGDQVQVTGEASGKYYWVYSPKLGKSGYVNSEYLIGASAPTPAPSGPSYTVSVKSGYLALRTAAAYDDSNIIGKLYSGDQVQVTGAASGKYYWVYSPKLGKSGYVNSEYLIGASAPTPAPSGPSYTVSVSSGYLALRTAPAYDDSNIIGELYSGDQVQVTGAASGKYYWVYSPKLGKSGYVNSEYLIGGSSPKTEYTVSVSSGYLALRTAPAYDDSNIIGELYSGDKVQVTGSASGKYYWVYSPKLGKSGYVNSEYLY